MPHRNPGRDPDPCGAGVDEDTRFVSSSEFERDDEASGSVSIPAGRPLG